MLDAFSDLSNGQLLILLAAATVAGLARGFSGFGSALIFMPLASAAIGPLLAAPLLLVVDAVAAAALIPNAWRQAQKREVAVMAIGAAIGVPLGTFALTQADPLAIRWGIVGIVALLLVPLLSGWRYRGAPAPALTVGVGALSGLFAGAAQAGGPPVVAYWLGTSDRRQTIRANIVLYFAASTLLTAASYAIGGLFVSRLLPLALLVGPLYALGLRFGAKLFGRASEATFRHLCCALIAVAVVVSLPVFD